MLTNVESKEAPQSNANRPPRPSTGQGPPPGESASGDLPASEASAEDPVLPEVTQSDSLHSQGVNSPTRPGNQQSVEDFGVATQQKSPFKGLPYDPTKMGETQI
jgi:hypothetical protein